jgi:hypothetical protein
VLTLHGICLQLEIVHDFALDERLLLNAETRTLLNHDYSDFVSDQTYYSTVVRYYNGTSTNLDDPRFAAVLLHHAAWYRWQALSNSVEGTSPQNRTCDDLQRHRILQLIFSSLFQCKSNAISPTAHSIHRKEQRQVALTLATQLLTVSYSNDYSCNGKSHTATPLGAGRVDGAAPHCLRTQT